MTTSALSTALASQQRALAAALDGGDPGDYVRLALVDIARSPGLAAAAADAPETIAMALVDAARLGLSVGGPSQESYLVPRKSHGRQEAQLLVGYRGLVKIALRDGAARSIWAEAVYAGDLFEVTRGTSPAIRHVPDYTARRRAADLAAVYAVADVGDGPPVFVVLSRGELDDLAGRVGGKVWRSDFAEMSKKTAIRRLCKVLAPSAQLAAALDLADAPPPEPIAAPRGPSGLVARMEARAEALRLADTTATKETP